MKKIAIVSFREKCHVLSTLCSMYGTITNEGMRQLIIEGASAARLEDI